MAKKKPSSDRYKNPKWLKKLGEHCRRIRKQKKFSIDRVYLEAETLSRSAIQRLEEGSHDVHVTVLYRYAEVLGVHPKELLDFD